MEITSKEKDCFFYMMMGDSTYFRLSLREIFEGMETTYTNVHGTVNLPEEQMIRIMQGPKVFLLGNQHVYCLDSVATDCPSIFPPDPDTSIHKISRLIHRKCSTQNPPIVETLEGKIYVLATPPRPKPKFIAQNLKCMHAETQRTSPLFFLVFDPSNNSWKHLSYPPHLKGSFRSFKVNSSKKPPYVERYCAWGHKLLVYGAGSASGTSYMYDTRLDKWVEFLDFEAMAFVEVHGFFIAVKRHPRRVVASRLDSNGIPGPEFKVLHQLDDIFCPFLRLDKCFMGRCGGDLLWIVHSSEYSHECYTTHVAIFQVSISLDHAGDPVLSAHLHAAGGYHLGGMAYFGLSSAFAMLQYSSNDDISEKQLAVKSLRYHHHYHFEDSVPCRFNSGWIGFSEPRLASSSGISETSHSSGSPPLGILPLDTRLFQEWFVPLRSVEDIHEKFKNYCLRKLTTSPWHDSFGLQVETRLTSELLGSIITKGFLTINRQAAVNGERSSWPSVGWGYVYQKARLDFFCSKEKLDALVDKCKALPSLTYVAMNREGSWISNIGQTDVNVVTWGVFPVKKMIEQTVVDYASFLLLKDKAFEIWTRGWASFYPEGDSSRKLLEEVHNSYFLVSLVDDDYIHGDLFALFADF